MFEILEVVSDFSRVKASKQTYKVTIKRGAPKSKSIHIRTV